MSASPGAGPAVVAAGQALPQPGQEPVLALVPEAVDDLGGGRPDLVGRRVLDVDGHVAGHEAAQVGGQRRLRGVPRLLRRAQDEAGGALRAQQPGGGLGDGLEVLVDVVLDGALVARLRPAALVVAPVHVALDERELLERVAPAHQQAREGAVDQQHGPGLAVGEARQRLDERGVGDDGLVVDGTGRRSTSKSPVGGGRETARPRAPPVAGVPLELGPGAREVRAQGGRCSWVRPSSARATTRGRAVQHGADLRGARRGSSRTGWGRG